MPIKIACIGDGREVSKKRKRGKERNLIPAVWLVAWAAWRSLNVLASDVAVRAGGLVGGWCTRPTARSGCTAHGAEARPSAPVVDASPLADAHARPSRKLADQEGPVGSKN